MASISELNRFIRWVTIVYCTRDHLKEGLEFSSSENREFFAEMGVELTPEEYDEYATMLANMLDTIDWFEGKRYE